MHEEERQDIRNPEVAMPADGTPEAPPPVALDAGRQGKARAYGRATRRLFFLDLGLTLVYLVAAAVSGVGGTLRDLLPDPAPLQAVVVLAILAVVYGVLTLPLHIYADYLLPRRYGLLTQGFPGWLLDAAKRGGVTLLLAGVFVALLYILLEAAPALWWLLAAGAFFLVSVSLAVLLPLVLVPLFFKQRPLADEALRTRLERLAERARARVAGVFIIDLSAKGTAANAALMGMGRTRRIVLTDTMLQTYTADEIETVLAHELGHHALGHISRGIALQGALALAELFIAHIVLTPLFPALGYQELSDVAGIPVLLLVLGAVGAAGVPLTGLASRRFERAADRFALGQSANPDAFISAMTKLADQNLAEADPPRWMHVLTGTHPTYRERVDMAQRLAPGLSKGATHRGDDGQAPSAGPERTSQPGV